MLTQGVTLKNPVGHNSKHRKCCGPTLIFHEKNIPPLLLLCGLSWQFGTNKLVCFCHQLMQSVDPDSNPNPLTLTSYPPHPNPYSIGSAVIVIWHGFTGPIYLHCRPNLAHGLEFHTYALTEEMLFVATEVGILLWERASEMLLWRSLPVCSV